ncbi:MAG: DUF2958 domain-containing protein [Myxococcales bacterium]|nr:MAG: DUF2958 domain-containing protein [Myxococcales bacterium]
MKQKLLTKEIREQLPPLYSQESKGMEAIAYLRLFHGYGRGVWLVTEFDGEDTFFGWAEIQAGCGELGYFSLSELESLDARINGRVIPGLQAIERDIHFKPTRLCDIKEIVRDNP